jgi:hypothetical protein
MAKKRDKDKGNNSHHSTQMEARPEDNTPVEAQPEQEEETTAKVTAPEEEVHPRIDAETPHVDPTGAADFDRPYDQWSNHDLQIRAKQLGVVGAVGHEELINKIREAEHKLVEQEAETAQPS